MVIQNANVPLKPARRNRTRLRKGVRRPLTQGPRSEPQLRRILNDRTRALRRSLQDLEAFSYTVSHDLRAPLRAILGYAEMLREECGANCGEHGRLYLDRIIAAAGRMNSFIEDVLAFSRAGRKDLELVSLSPAEVIRDVLQSHAAFQAADVEVVLPIPRVRGNPAALGICLTNLLSNAIKYVPPGQKPCVRIGPAPASGPSRVRLVVDDNGIGVPPEFRDRLFKLFQRLHPGYEGSGVGLAIVQKAAERMGGTAGYEPGPQGSRFWIELPAAPEISL